MAAQQGVMDLAPGLLVGGYRLEARLGEGGMGVVWSAAHVESGERVALKLVKHEDHEARRRLVREARAATAVKHPAVLQVHEVLELDDGAPVIVMDLLLGETLRAHIERLGPLSLGMTAKILLPVVSAVATAHEAGVVHRDLKPENVFLAAQEDGTVGVRVLDFGIAKLVQTTGTDSRLTATGALVGTPAYMSIEQLLGEGDIDGRSDTWALGVMLYECLTAVLPTAASNYGQVIKRIINDGILPIAAAVPDLPPDACEMVDRMLARARDERPALDDVRALLERHVGEAPIPAAPPRPPSAAPGAARAAAELAPTVALGRAAPTTTTAPLGVHAKPEPADLEPGAPSVAAARTSTRVVAAAIGALIVAGGLAVAFGGREPRASNPAAAAAPSSGPCGAGRRLVEGGAFRMGADDGEADERPVHDVAVKSFCLDEHEVTVAHVTQCVSDGQCRPISDTVQRAGLSAADRALETSLCHGTRADRLTHPANCVDWDQAREYCEYAGGRLPTEEEWEYAARGGGELRLFPWGDARPDPTRLNACDPTCLALWTEKGRKYGKLHDVDDGFPLTAPPATFPAGASRHGIHDLAGNVGEWTSSAYCSYPDKKCESPQRVYRGAGWATVLVTSIRSTNRLWAEPSTREVDLGIRCARDL